MNSLRIIGNEKVYFHVGPLGTIDFLEVELNPTGASSDRYSPVATWDVTLTRSVVAEKIRSLAGNIGEFKDLKPSRIDNSGRAVQIQVIGSRASVVLNGLKVGNALGLRRHVIYAHARTQSGRQYLQFYLPWSWLGPRSRIMPGRRFRHGKGWTNLRRDLKTYYQGVEIRKAY